MASALPAPAGVFDIPGLKQLVLLAGLAAAIAGGLWLVFWTQGQSYAPVYSQLSERETAQVADALTAAGIQHRLDGPSGSVLVPEGQVREARLKLAGQGLPQSDALGVELIQKDTGFGTSQFMEGARYQLALETELARTIVKVQGVQNARVHLALPKASAFVREQRHPTASVMLQLYPGRRLEPGQVAAITHLIASSVPELEAGEVTVVDQAGSLLSTPDGGDALALSAKQLEYTRHVEESYARRIEDLLVPLLGPGRVRAGVTAALDFTQSEATSENFDPAKQVIRSEQTSSDSHTGGEGAQGIPGALSNQPPQTAPQPAIPAPGAAPAAPARPGAQAQAAPPPPSSNSQRATRNYEIDHTVSHTQQPTGNLRRLSIAVVLDNRQGTDADGKPTSTPLAAEEIERYGQLIRDAVGFDDKRGDKIEIINASFSAPAPLVAPEPEPWYENGTIRQFARQGLAAVLVLILALVVLRPIMKNLLSPPRSSGGRELGADRVTLSGAGAAGMAAGAPGMALAAPSFEQQVAAARSITAQDPRRAAQVVKDWVATDGR
jgi:flagellar M-ring protein FliF